MGCPFFWWTRLCLWDFLCALRLHWQNNQIHLLRKCSNYSCTWDLASAAYNWVIGLSVHPWLPLPDVLLFPSCSIFVLSVWGVCCCGTVPRPPHSLISSSCFAWLVRSVLVGTRDCWILCLVFLFWMPQPLCLCVIVCCGPEQCYWPSIFIGRAVVYAPCVSLTADC